MARIEHTSDSFGEGARGWHYVGSYKSGGLTLAIGTEDMDADVEGTYGASTSYSFGPYYVAAKYENASNTGEIYNLFGQVSADKFTYKFGTGLGDQYSGQTFHAGIDYQYRDNFKFFTEIYSEEKNYALLAGDANSASDYYGAGGFGAKQSGKALLAGFRVDVSTQ